MDERKLAEAFRDAADGAPAPAFDLDSVRSASKRATLRRRSALAAGSTLAVVLLAGGVAAGGLLPVGGPERASSALESQAPATLDMEAATAEPRVLGTEDGPRGEAGEPTGGQPPKSIPGDPSEQGDEPPGSADPTVGGTPSGCGAADRELAVALAGELPVARDLVPTGVTGCPAGARGASYLVRAGADYATVSVVLVPAGVRASLATDLRREAVATTASGESVHVLSEPAAGATTAPYAADLPGLAQAIAAGR
ncbi:MULTISPECIES: hypothetical protein [Actinosynnema]|uniref:Uncharacterized protein n=1 Tax=Actinosynnema pretiosum TaxID=42197 RepID=A0A290ZFC1_9PSEU|nr:hypothetical protein [Actinosynnema pretiosum]ATE57716.1 hypothetical protein CNX65_34070 [Actinosynnema pretiosum]